ncbi:unnamed protein product, partial [marine sediment metagenome]
CKGADHGKQYSGSACQELAKFYLKGNSVDRDVARAVDLLRRGCKRPSRRACLDLGNLLLDEQEIEQDVAGAVAAFSRACEGKKKEAKACSRLGVMLARGVEIPRDAVKAEQFLIDGCTFPKWVGTACYELARLYETDLSGRKSEQEITDIYRVACQRADSKRNGDACVAAARRELEGKGKSQGIKQGNNWASQLYSRGCQLKHLESCKLSCELHCQEGQQHACRPNFP